MRSEDPVGEVIGLLLCLMSVFSHFERCSHYASVVD